MFINLLKLNISFGQKVICFYSQYKHIVEKNVFLFRRSSFTQPMLEYNRERNNCWEF